MSIRKKFFVTIFLVISSILLLSYFFIYLIFYNAMHTEASKQQNGVIAENRAMLGNFFTQFNTVALLFSADEAMGTYLSQAPSDTLSNISVSNSMYRQMYLYSAVQTGSYSHFFKNYFFINDILPVSNAFPAKTLTDKTLMRSSNILSNSLVKDEAWYQCTLVSNNNPYIFFNSSTKEYCIAKKSNNAYFTRSYQSNGTGVIAVCINEKHFINSLSFSRVSENSQTAIFNSTDELLYYSHPNDNLNEINKIYQKYQSELLKNSIIDVDDISIDGNHYLLSLSRTDYGVTLLFLTPLSDIQALVNSRMLPYLMIVLSFSVFIAVIIYFLSFQITAPIIKLSKIIDGIKDTRDFNPKSFEVFHDKELVMLCQSFQTNMERVNQLITDIELRKNLEKKAELRALQAQINPHFIFNAMDVVNWLALSKNEDEIAEIVSSIANLMRYSITKPDEMIPIEDELQNIQEFITIYKFRHKTEPQLKIINELEHETIMIPKFSLQPLVENSLKHGAKNLNETIQITIKIFLIDSILYIHVIDDGIGCDPAQLNKYLSYLETNLSTSSGFGIRNVNDRIHLYYNTESGLNYYINEEGFLTAQLTLDQRKWNR